MKRPTFRACPKVCGNRSKGWRRQRVRCDYDHRKHTPRVGGAIRFDNERSTKKRSPRRSRDRSRCSSDSGDRPRRARRCATAARRAASQSQPVFSWQQRSHAAAMTDHQANRILIVYLGVARIRCLLNDLVFAYSGTRPTLTKSPRARSTTSIRSYSSISSCRPTAANLFLGDASVQTLYRRVVIPSIISYGR